MISLLYRPPPEGRHGGAKPEIYMWEKIKLIDHQAMPPQVNKDENVHRYAGRGEKIENEREKKRERDNFFLNTVFC